MIPNSLVITNSSQTPCNFSKQIPYNPIAGEEGRLGGDGGIEEGEAPIGKRAGRERRGSGGTVVEGI